MTIFDKLRALLPIPRQHFTLIGRIHDLADAAPGAIVRLRPHDRRHPIPMGFAEADALIASRLEGQP